MKLLRVSLGMFTLVTLIAASCSRNSGTSVNGSPTSICVDYSQDTFGEDVAEFEKAVARYNRTHGIAVAPAMIAEGIKSSPSRVAIIPFDTLKKFLYYVERYSSEAGLSTSQLRVPIYYAMHDQTDIYGGLHTIYVGVAVDIGEDLVPFDPKLSSQNGSIVPVDSLNNRLTEQMGGVALSQTTFMLSGKHFLRNQYHLCPPNCPPESSLEKLLQDIDYNTRSLPLSYRN